MLPYELLQRAAALLDVLSNLFYPRNRRSRALTGSGQALAETMVQKKREKIQVNSGELRTRQPLEQQAQRSKIKKNSSKRIWDRRKANQPN